MHMSERVNNQTTYDMDEKKCELSIDFRSSKRKKACQVAPRFSKLARVSMHRPSPSSSSQSTITSASSSSGDTSEEESLPLPQLNTIQMTLTYANKKKKMKKKSRKCNQWMRFCSLFSLLRLKLPSSSVASLQRVWTDFQVGKITREKLIVNFRNVASDQILAESIQILQSLHARDTENSDSS